jgi:hypothetical protein
MKTLNELKIEAEKMVRIGHAHDASHAQAWVWHKEKGEDALTVMALVLEPQHYRPAIRKAVKQTNAYGVCACYEAWSARRGVKPQSVDVVYAYVEHQDGTYARGEALVTLDENGDRVLGPVDWNVDIDDERIDPLFVFLVSTGPESFVHQPGRTS